VLANKSGRMSCHPNNVEIQMRLSDYRDDSEIDGHFGASMLMLPIMNIDTIISAVERL
jgi:hypothetical protein